MRLGFTEFILIAAIALVAIGPTFFHLVNRWIRQAERANRASQKRRAAAAAARHAQQEDILHRFRIAGAGFFLVAAVGVVYALFLRPIPITPSVYSPSALRTETALASQTDSTAFPLGGCLSVGTICTQDDWVYLTVQLKKGSALLRVHPDGSGLSSILTQDGELSGFAFAPDGSIWLALNTDKTGGLYRAVYDGWGATVEAVVTQIDGRTLSPLSSVITAPDGTVYFAEFAQAFDGADAPSRMRTELLTHTNSGQIYAYHPTSRKVENVLSGLAGVSGLALSPDGATLYAADLANRTVWAVPASVRNVSIDSRECVRLVYGLDYYPSGLSCGTDGQLTVGSFLLYSDWLESNADSPFWRGVALRLTENTQKKLLGWNASASVSAEQFNAEGVLTARFLAENSGRIHAVYGDAERVYLGSVSAENGLFYCRK